MAKLRWTALTFLLLAAVLLFPASAGGVSLGWIPSSLSGCLVSGEFGLGSEVTRRFLATSGYISYGALRRDTTPCSRRGASYYNCRPGAQANPYSRGCSSISQCRG